MLNWLGLPVQASTHAAEIDQMTALVHWLMLVLFVGWGAFFLFVLFRFRKGANPTASYAGAKGKVAKSIEVARRGHRNRAARLLRHPRLGDARRTPSRAKTRRSSSASSPSSSRGTCSIRAATAGSAGPMSKLVSADNPLGLDRTDPDAKDDITTINQLNLPVDRPILVHLSSKDVIHSFGLYEMRVKQDAIPGMEIPVWFIPNRLGDYEITCSQLCGLGHYRMRGFVTIQSQSDFETWMATQEKELATEQAR